MPTFALIFRQPGGPLGEADVRKRSQETRAWAQPLNAAGHKLVPHILAAEGRWIGAGGRDGPPPAEGGPLTALLFLEARDLDEAERIARAHPGVRYGASVEVRPWAPPAAQS